MYLLQLVQALKYEDFDEIKSGLIVTRRGSTASVVPFTEVTVTEKEKRYVFSPIKLSSNAVASFRLYRESVSSRNSENIEVSVPESSNFTDMPVVIEEVCNNKA